MTKPSLRHRREKLEGGRQSFYRRFLFCQFQTFPKKSVSFVTHGQVAHGFRNEKSVNLWREAFFPRGGLFSLGKNARGGIPAWAKVPGEAFLPGGAFQTLTPAQNLTFFPFPP